MYKRFNNFDLSKLLNKFYTCAPMQQNDEKCPKMKIAHITCTKRQKDILLRSINEEKNKIPGPHSPRLEILELR